jgi:hypothetical protein
MLALRTAAGFIGLGSLFWFSGVVQRSLLGAVFCLLVALAVSGQYYCLQRALPHLRLDDIPSVLPSWLPGQRWSPLPQHYAPEGRLWVVGFLCSTALLLVTFVGVGSVAFVGPTPR